MNKKKLFGISLSILLSIAPTISSAMEFKDTSSTWAKSYIEYFHKKGIINGSGNNRFYPEQNMKTEEFLKILYSSINKLEPSLFNPQIIQEVENNSTESVETTTTTTTSENNSTESVETTTTTTTSENNPSEEKVATEDAEKKQEEQPVSKEEEVKKEEESKTQENTTEPTEKNTETPSVPAENTTVTKEHTVTEQASVPSKPKLTMSFKNDHTNFVVSKLYQNGLLDSINLNDKFLASSLTRQRVVLICQNYDKVRQSRNIDSHRADQLLEKNGWLNKKTGKLLSPNQVLTRGEAMKMIYQLLQDEKLPQNHKVELKVPHISQMTPVCAPVGCEPVSLLMCLRSKGYCKDVSIRSYLNHVPRHKNDPEIAFAGSPYVPNNALRTTIFPKPLAKYGMSYGADIDDLTGKNTKDLKEELYKGRPVVAYVTLYWRKPYYRNYRINGKTRTYLRNNHALVVAGYDPTAKKFLIVDPYNVHGMKARYWISENTFRPLYEVRKHAVSVK